MAPKAIKPRAPINKLEVDFTTTKKTIATKKSVANSLNKRSLMEEIPKPPFFCFTKILWQAKW